VDADRIVVAPNGATAMPRPDYTVVPHHPYLLAVGSLTPRKGLDTLFAALAHAALPASVGLVLAGATGWDGHRVLDAIDHNHVSDRVTCTGRVTDAQLAALYERCIAVCVPSVAEGFGLPLLEAAAAGVPVVASDLPVFRELEGLAALYAPPRDERAWTEALERIVADDALRRESAVKSHAVAREYTWDRTAAIALGAYEQARQAV
jgi:glycosyltransferase involved in cell wall biosynthesis